MKYNKFSDEQGKAAEHHKAHHALQISHVKITLSFVKQFKHSLYPRKQGSMLSSKRKYLNIRINVYNTCVYQTSAF